MLLIMLFNIAMHPFAVSHVSSCSGSPATAKVPCEIGIFQPSGDSEVSLVGTGKSVIILFL